MSEKEGERERGRKREEGGKEGERKRDVEYGCFIFLKGMTGTLAPFSYLVRQ
jgi:hypothetical protein